MSFGIGVIGAGIHGARYLNHAAKDVPGMHAAALCRRDTTKGEALARERECRYYQDAGELVNDPQVEGVIVCTPPSTHFQFAEMVLAAGKALLVEKPCTGTLDQAVRLAELDRTSPAPPLMVAQTLRWNPVIGKVRELWHRLGRVHLVRLAQRLEPTTLAWQRNPEETVGGSVLLTGVHIFDLARHLTGAEFTAVDSRQQNILNPVAEDLFLARATLDDGCWVSLEVSKYTRSRCGWLEAVGEKGQIWADYLAGGVLLRTEQAEEKFDIPANVPTLPMVLSEWLTAARNQSPPAVTITDGLATLQIADACYRSDQEQRSVILPSRKT